MDFVVICIWIWLWSGLVARELALIVEKGLICSGWAQGLIWSPSILLVVRLGNDLNN